MNGGTVSCRQSGNDDSPHMSLQALTSDIASPNRVKIPLDFPRGSQEILTSSRSPCSSEVHIYLRLVEDFFQVGPFPSDDKKGPRTSIQPGQEGCCQWIPRGHPLDNIFPIFHFGETVAFGSDPRHWGAHDPWVDEMKPRYVPSSHL